jgi:hypothetical protein
VVGQEIGELAGEFHAAAAQGAGGQLLAELGQLGAAR